MVYFVVHVKGLALRTLARASTSAGRGRLQTQICSFGGLFCDGLVSPSPIAVLDLRPTDTLNAGGAPSKHTLTVLYSLVPVLFPFHP